MAVTGGGKILAFSDERLISFPHVQKNRHYKGTCDCCLKSENEKKVEFSLYFLFCE